MKDKCKWSTGRLQEISTTDVLVCTLFTRHFTIKEFDILLKILRIFIFLNLHRTLFGLLTSLTRASPLQQHPAVLQPEMGQIRKQRIRIRIRITSFCLNPNPKPLKFPMDSNQDSRIHREYA